MLSFSDLNAKSKVKKYTRERSYLKSLIPDDLLSLLNTNRVYVAGGAITSIFSAKKINDLDLYFRTTKELSNIKQFLTDNENWLLKFESENALSYENTEGLKVQLIRYSEFINEDIASLFKFFDFTVCMAAFDFKSDEFVFHEYFMPHLSQRRLIFNPGTQYPFSSMIRTMKYQRRGYTIKPLEFVKIGLAVNMLDLNEPGELQKQLEGIDTLFLKAVFDKYGKDNPSAKNGTIELSNFLSYIEDEYGELDEIFGE